MIDLSNTNRQGLDDFAKSIDADPLSFKGVLYVMGYYKNELDEDIFKPYKRQLTPPFYCPSIPILKFVFDFYINCWVFDSINY